VIGEADDKEGVKIVLTASRTDMSDFEDDAFTAFLCTFPRLLAGIQVKKYLKPCADEDGTCRFAPYGLRKVEALLVEEFGRENVVVAHPLTLNRFVGLKTQLIGISVHDPMGLAYVSMTYNSLIGFGGESLNQHEFKRLMENPVFRNFEGKIIAGGPGVWQIRDAKLQDTYGIDVLMAGEAENDLIPLVHRLLNEERVDKYVHARKTDPRRDRVPVILKPSTFGSVEITRGCGRGCRFCTPTTRQAYSFPIDHIMKEVKVNIDGGLKSIFIVTDDVFLYQSFPDFRPNREKLAKLFNTIAAYPGVQRINLSHGSIAPIVYDPKMLAEISPILLEKSGRKLRGKPFQTIEVGIETGSTRIMTSCMKGKALPLDVKDWHEIVTQGLSIMNDNGWYPLCTMITGLPGESEDDILQTLELMDKMKGYTLFYVPLLFIPLEDAVLRNAKRCELDHINELQWEFIATSWRRNLDIWAGERSWYYRMLGFPLCWALLRWKHGSSATRAVMKSVGMPEFLLPIGEVAPCVPMPKTSSATFEREASQKSGMDLKC